MTMRSINVSTEVLAARQPEQETEDDILRRVAGRHPNVRRRVDVSGFHDRRYDVHFPEGFEVFRTYPGRDHRARATGGTWLLLSDGRRCGGLDELSQAIGTKTENAWVDWFFTAPNGQQKRASDLRDPSKIRGRKPRKPVVEIDVSDL